MVKLGPSGVWVSGPLHISKNFIEKSIIEKIKLMQEKQTTGSDQVITKDLSKSDAIASFEKIGEENLPLLA